MGTSVNQSSPKTLNWQSAQVCYRSADIPVDRVTAEVWRAATNQERGDLGKLLSGPIIPKLAQMAARAESRLQLSRDASLEIVATKSSSLATDIARRAAIQSLVSRDRVGEFCQRVFAEATSYLICRDFPGFVGGGRARTVSESMEFKGAVAEHVVRTVKGIGTPRSLTPKNWAKYTQKIITGLQGKRK
jgi:hypothetical protein